MFQKLVQYRSSGTWKRILFPFFDPRHKTLTGPKFTTNHQQQKSGYSNGYRLEPMSPQLLVPASASSDGAAAASPGRAVMASPGVGGESLRRRHSWDSLRRRAVSTPIAAARRLRAVRGVPAAPFYAWMVAVSAISKINGPEKADLQQFCTR